MELALSGSQVCPWSHAPGPSMGSGFTDCGVPCFDGRYPGGTPDQLFACERDLDHN